MRNNNVFSFLFFLLLFLSCKESIVRVYNEQGQLEQVRVYVEDDIWQIETYYSDGVLKERGKVRNDVRIGEWEEWYSDGIKKWRGVYVDGERDISVFQQIPEVLISNNENSLFVDTLNAIKVIVEGLHPKDAVYVTNTGEIKACVNDDAYDIYLIPEKIGELRLMVYALAFRDDLFIGEVILNVK